MLLTSCDPKKNHILSALSAEEYEQLIPHLELVTLSRAEVLFDANEKLQSVYFPITATTSLLCCFEDGSSVQVAMVGNEGIVGVSVLLGSPQTMTQAIISGKGHAYRVSVKVLQNVLTRSEGRREGTLNKLLVGYMESLMIQMSQMAACNRRHRLENQLCTWLLLCSDYSSSNTLSHTHESISYILGVRRESITVVAKKLHEEGLISYSRGHIELKDRDRLENAACECYHIAKEESCRWKKHPKAAYA